MVAYPRWRMRRLDSPGTRKVDLAITALVLSVAAIAWFGWGQAEPPSGWSPVFAAGEIRLLPAWILLVVGVHFLPLGRVFRIAELYSAGVAVSVIAIAAAITGAATSVAPSTVAGAGGGLVCLITALLCLRRSRAATADEGSA